MTQDQIFSADNLPPFKADSNGHLRPKPEGTVAACMSPLPVNYPYPENWGMDKGATMEVPAGGMITCLGPKDSYYNAEFGTTSSLTGAILDPKKDERAAELDAFFYEKHNLKVLIVEAKKTVGLDVLGEVAEETVGEIMETREGPQELSTGDVIVKCPRSGDVWRITPENRAKRYAEDGKVFSGKLPDEYC